MNNLPKVVTRQCSGGLVASPTPGPLDHRVTIQHRTILIRFPPNLQTIVVALMLFIGGEGTMTVIMPGLHSRTIAWTVSSELLGFCFYFSLLLANLHIVLFCSLAPVGVCNTAQRASSVTSRQGDTLFFRFCAVR